jgi:SAM-dependent methyltransferase
MEVRDAYGPTDARHCDFAFESFRSPSGDVGFYRELAREAGGRVLELGCGTGRVLLSIARDGIACTGLDSSQEMLEELRRKSPPENLRLVQGSMQDFDLQAERFALIFSAFRSFQHLLTVEDQLACLRAVRRHLAPGGLFAFDVFAPKLERVALLEEPEFEEARWREEETEIVRFTSVRRDPATQVSEVTFRYERRRPGSPPQSHTVRTRMRHLFRYEIEHLLARAGFTDIQVFGGFDRRPFDYFSGETVVLAR